MANLIAITGASGFIAKEFQRYYKEKYDFIRISRVSNHVYNTYSWDEIAKTPQLLANVCCVINLAGVNIGAKRWSKARKKELLNSRVITTENLVLLLNSLPYQPALLCASAVGIYPSNEECDEDSLIDYNHYANFSEEITKKWEKAARAYKGRVVNMRFGVVLSSNGGALSKILFPFKLGIGCGISSGDWYFSWISSNDLVRAIDYLIERYDIVGIVNLVAPQLIKYKELIAAISNVYHIKLQFNLPKLVIHYMFGQMGDELLLNGQSVAPKRLLEQKFAFLYPTIIECIEAIHKKVI